MVVSPKHSKPINWKPIDLTPLFFGGTITTKITTKTTSRPKSTSQIKIIKPIHKLFSNSSKNHQHKHKLIKLGLTTKKLPIPKPHSTGPQIVPESKTLTIEQCLAAAYNKTTQAVPFSKITEAPAFSPLTYGEANFSAVERIISALEMKKGFIFSSKDNFLDLGKSAEK